MHRKPLIGITAGEAKNKYYPNAPKMYGQQYTYIEAIERAGGVPLILPIVKDEAVMRQLFELCDGLLLAGGNDINPTTYGEKLAAHTKHIHQERDKQELALATWAVAEDKPLLAICRGMQLLNIVQGGTLYQDIPTQLPQADTHEIPDAQSADRERQLVHSLELEPKSKLAQIMATTTIQTNAYHHQAIKTLGTAIAVTSRTPDEVIESIEMPDRQFAIGVQSHPESLEADIEPQWRKLFDAFVDAAQASRREP